MGKKKGAGNKLAKMTEEERLRYLQHRAEIEEEARRRKQQLVSIFMKVHPPMSLNVNHTDTIAFRFIHRIN